MDRHVRKASKGAARPSRSAGARRTPASSSARSAKSASPRSGKSAPPKPAKSSAAKRGRRPARSAAGPDSTSALFWRRRFAVLLLAGVVVGLAYWPLAGWLSDVRDNIVAASRQASGKQQETGKQEKTDKQQEAGQQKTGGEGGGTSETDQGEGTGRAAQPNQGGQSDRDKRADPDDRTDDRSGTGKPVGAESQAGGEDRAAGALGPGGERPRKPEVPVCAEGDVAVSVRPERDSAIAGRPLAFELSVRNDGKRLCRIPPDPRWIRVAVLAGSERVLDTDRCPAPIEVRPARMKPGKSATVTVQWNGRRTASDCSADAPPAGPGGYSVQAEVLGAFSDAVPFELR